MSCSPGVSTGVGEAGCKQITKGEDKQPTWRTLAQEQLVAKDTGLRRGATAPTKDESPPAVQRLTQDALISKSFT